MLVSRLFAVLSQTVRYIQALNVWKIFSQKENHELFHSSSLNISRVISTREGKLFSGLEFGSCLLCRTFDSLRCWNKTQRISQIQYPFGAIYMHVWVSLFLIVCFVFQVSKLEEIFFSNQKYSIRIQQVGILIKLIGSMYQK